MKLYRKKPVVIKAWQYFVGNELPTELKIRGDIIVNNDSIFIETLEGLMNVSDGDYIIIGVNGEAYPCKPDIFNKTYEIENVPMKCHYCGRYDDELIQAFTKVYVCKECFKCL